jgi:hypothetical protein
VNKKQSIQTKRQADMSTIGTALVKDAKKEFEEEQTAKVSTVVQNILRCIEESKVTMENGRLALDFFNRQMTAIREGKFTFSRIYGPSRPQIIFNDPVLNGTWIDEVAKSRW